MVNVNCSLPSIPPSSFPNAIIDVLEKGGRQYTVLGGGCFWCVEAVFKSLDGVLGVVSGYSGGAASSANYEAVCTGTTHHAEVIRIEFDPALVTFGELLKVFFSIAHDPTQVNRQGNDIGTQYRSAIFFVDEEQRLVAESYIAQLNKEEVYNDPICTTLEPLDEFFEAELYHQNYVENNKGHPYITYVAEPKIKKLRDQFPERLKS